MFDTLHALYRDEIPPDYARAMKDDLVHIHISDEDRMLPGKERVDWVGLLQALRECAFEGYLTMELGLTVDQRIQIASPESR